MCFWNKTLYVSDSSSVHHHDHTGLLTACTQAISKPVWHIPLLCVQWKTPDDGPSNCPKHVDFYSKNKFEKLVHLVGFTIRIYHDARSSERQILCNLLISSTRPTLHYSALSVLSVCVPTVHLSRLSWLSKLYCPEGSHVCGGAALSLHCLSRVCFWGQCLFPPPLTSSPVRMALDVLVRN